VATGIGSVATQLYTVREVLAQFSGNELVIALILFIWLLLGGAGTYASLLISRRTRPSLSRLGWLSFALAALSPLVLLGLRLLRDALFLPGSSVGFYPTLLFLLGVVGPYALLVGFLLPYALFVIRAFRPDYPGAFVYISDNLGDVAGGAVFSFGLVLLVTPLWGILWANLPLVAASWNVFPESRRLRPVNLLAVICTLAVLSGAVAGERASLQRQSGRLVHYEESKYGRFQVYEEHGQLTLYADGAPLYSSQNEFLAEATVHSPLSQLEAPRRILLLSAQAGVMEEIAAYDPEKVDYVELDPAIPRIMFRFGFLSSIPGLEVIHRDGRSFVRSTERSYDAAILCLPEPETYKHNRYFTAEFFGQVKERLHSGGIFSFSVEGFDNYPSREELCKISALRAAAKRHFRNVLILPGQKTFFLCSDGRLDPDIPGLLQARSIATDYVAFYYPGNVTPERIRKLEAELIEDIGINRDFSPVLMRLMFEQWFAKFSSSPLAFYAALGLLLCIYSLRMSREEFVLFSTGWVNIGGEIAVIFAFQILFGYIYTWIGFIVTAFLAGLLPGAFFGERIRRSKLAVLRSTDALIVALMAGLILLLTRGGQSAPPELFLGFGFLLSVCCGLQFPAALALRGGTDSAATRAFSADLLGAACGALVVSVVCLPHVGLLWSLALLLGLKLVSLALNLLPGRS